jgi:hypothetical protein
VDRTIFSLIGPEFFTSQARGGTVVKVLRYKTESRWFDP